MGLMLKRIESTITEDEIKVIFDFFDINKDGEITFQEFQTNL